MLYSGKRVLGTGGTGFIGSNLVARILREGGQVTVLTRQDKKSEGIVFVKGDITDRDILCEITKNVDIVFHLAGFADVAGAIRNPELAFNTDVMGTFLLLDAARKNNVGKVIYVSSARVYGDPLYTPQDEKHPLHPKEFYGASKVIGETYCNVFKNNFGLKIVIVRPFSVYGEGQIPKRGSMSGVVSIFVHNALNGEDLTVTGDGLQMKDFVHISDTVEGIILASLNDKCVGEAINIGYGESTTIKRVAELVLQETGAKVTIRQIGQVGENVNNCSDISKARGLLNYQPKVTMLNGLERYIKWVKSKAPRSDTVR